METTEQQQAQRPEGAQEPAEAAQDAPGGAGRAPETAAASEERWEALVGAARKASPVLREPAPEGVSPFAPEVDREWRQAASDPGVAVQGYQDANAAGALDDGRRWDFRRDPACPLSPVRELVPAGPLEPLPDMTAASWPPPSQVPPLAAVAAAASYPEVPPPWLRKPETGPPWPAPADSETAVTTPEGETP